MIVLRQQKVVGGTRSEAKDRRWYAGEALSTFCKFTKGLEGGSRNKSHILRGDSEGGAQHPHNRFLDTTVRFSRKT